MILPVYLQEADRAIKHALAREPGLTRRGYSTPGAGHVGETLNPQCVATALAFLDLGPVRILHSARRNQGSGSYALKHFAEQWGKLLEWEPYVTNDDIVAALIYRQIPIRRDIRNSPNCATSVRVDHEVFERLARAQRKIAAGMSLEARDGGAVRANGPVGSGRHRAREGH